MHIILSLPPVSCSRPRVTRFGTYYAPKYRKWKKQASNIMQTYVETKYEGNVSVFIEFDTAIPKSYSKKQRNAILGGCDKKLPHYDLDNGIKAVFDAMTDAGVWGDDTQVAQVTASKRYAEKDEIRIRVEEI